MRRRAAIRLLERDRARCYCALRPPAAVCRFHSASIDRALSSPVRAGRRRRAGPPAARSAPCSRGAPPSSPAAVNVAGRRSAPGRRPSSRSWASSEAVKSRPPGVRVPLLTLNETHGPRGTGFNRPAHRGRILPLPGSRRITRRCSAAANGGVVPNDGYETFRSEFAERPSVWS